MKFFKSILLFLLIILTQSSCFTVKNNQHFNYQKLEPSDYASRLKDSSNFILIDVRTPGEYNKSHINGAINYSYLKFHFGKDIKDLDRNKIIFVYCQTCHRSPFAAKTLKRKGFRKVYDLKGGYVKWTSH